MRIIDAHNHLLDEPGFLDGLLRTLDDLGIEKCCVSGLGSLFGMVDNAGIRAAFEAHPDRIVGAVFVRPGVDGPEAVRRGFEQGFRMVKVTVPRGPYDDPAFFPIWEQSLEHGMPVLFHTGTVAPMAQGRGERISSWAMHPMRIEPITREFPELKVLIAHLGVVWNHDAADLARMRPNVYVDLTGEPGGWRVRADRDGMDTWLWWSGAFRRVVFGTDVHYSKMKTILDQDLARMERLGIDTETRDRVMGGNIADMLGI